VDQHQPGLYETLISEALAAELRQLGDRLEWNVRVSGASSASTAACARCWAAREKRSSGR